MVYLAAFGLLFPLISWVTAALSWWAHSRDGRNHSAILIPFFGPIGLTVYVILEDLHCWLIPIAWLTDLGTLAFLAMVPSLSREWWRTSRFTLILTLRGNRGIESAILRLHSGGHYLLEKSWNRGPGDMGVINLGEPGTYIEIDGGYEMTAHFGLRRILKRCPASIDGITFFVYESTIPVGLEYYSLESWTLNESG